MGASLLNLISAAAGRILRNGETSLTLVLCLTTILFPFITALAVSKGLHSQALLSVQNGPEMTLQGEVYGNPGPVPESEIHNLRERLAPITSQVKGRIVGRTTFVNRIVALVGLEPFQLAGPFPLSQGRLIQKENEVLVGYYLARTFHLQPGVRFSLTANPDRLFTVAGILKATSLWDSELVVMALSDAQAFFRMKGFVTEAHIGSDPDQSPQLQEMSKPGLISKKEAFQWLDKGYALSSGIFIPFWILLAALTIPSLLVSSGLGSSETIREVSLLTSLGWSRTQLMVLTAMEGGVLSLTATSLATLFSMAWMKLTNGFLIAGFFVAEVGLVPDFSIPTRYLPLPSLIGLCFVLSITLVGSLSAVWFGTRRVPYGALR